MELGNNFVGLTTNQGYYAIKICPIGLELCFFEDCWEIALVLGTIEINLALKKNITLFR